MCHQTGNESGEECFLQKEYFKDSKCQELTSLHIVNLKGQKETQYNLLTTVIMIGSDTNRPSM